MIVRRHSEAVALCIVDGLGGPSYGFVSARLCGGWRFPNVAETGGFR
jgi:hypothetical protein